MHFPPFFFFFFPSGNVCGDLGGGLNEHALMPAEVWYLTPISGEGCAVKHTAGFTVVSRTFTTDMLEGLHSVEFQFTGNNKQPCHQELSHQESPSGHIHTYSVWFRLHQKIVGFGLFELVWIQTSALWCGANSRSENLPERWSWFASNRLP